MCKADCPVDGTTVLAPAFASCRVKHNEVATQNVQTKQGLHEFNLLLTSHLYTDMASFVRKSLMSQCTSCV